MLILKEMSQVDRRGDHIGRTLLEALRLPFEELGACKTLCPKPSTPKQLPNLRPQISPMQGTFPESRDGTCLLEALRPCDVATPTVLDEMPCDSGHLRDNRDSGILSGR